MSAIQTPKVQTGSRDRGKILRRTVLLGLLGLTLTGGSHAAAPRPPRAGDTLPNLLEASLLVRAAIGDPPPRKGWIVYVFRPSSAIAQADTSQLGLIQGSDRSDWGLLALATRPEDRSSLLDRLPAPISVVAQTPRATLSAYAAGARVRTFVLDPTWEVLEILDGPWAGETAARLRSRLQAGAAAPRKIPPKALSPGQGRAEAREAAERVLCFDANDRGYSRGSRAEAWGRSLTCEGEAGWRLGS